MIGAKESIRKNPDISQFSAKSDPILILRIIIYALYISNTFFQLSLTVA